MWDWVQKNRLLLIAYSKYSASNYLVNRTSLIQYRYIPTLLTQDFYLCFPGGDYDMLSIERTFALGVNSIVCVDITITSDSDDETTAEMFTVRYDTTDPGVTPLMETTTVEICTSMLCTVTEKLTDGHWPFSVQFSITVTQNLIMIVPNCTDGQSQFQFGQPNSKPYFQLCSDSIG